MENKKKEPPAKRSAPVYPKDYLLSVADKIHKMNPTLPTLYNMIKEIYGKGFENGYLRNIGDMKYFRDKKEERRKRSFDMAATNIDNLIHNKKNK